MQEEKNIEGYNSCCFIQRLDELRGKLSITKFAAFLGMSRQTVGFYLNGDRLPDFNSIIRIAQKCNVSTDYLLGVSDIPRKEPEILTLSRFLGFSQSKIHNLREIGKRKDLKLSIEAHIDYLYYAFCYLPEAYDEIAANFQQTEKEKEKAKEMREMCAHPDRYPEMLCLRKKRSDKNA